MTDAATSALAAALPSYDIGRELGRGGFGIVYSGVQRHLGRQVAIKQLPTQFASDDEVRERFATEARVVASLEHPHIVPVYDYVERDGLCLLVMEALTGGSVWDVFRKDGLNPAHACVLVIASAAGLHHAHVNNVLHRDVKPENLLLTGTNHLKVTDFGIAKVISGHETVATNDGAILGTPAYMAPEQADGSPLTPAADVYAAGVMLYELLSGTLPYSQDGGGLAIVFRHLHERPTPLQDVAPHVPRPIAEVVMRALERQASDRYATAEEFAVAIGESAVNGFGQFWYRESGLRVIGSDNVMSTLSGSIRQSVLPPGVAPPTSPGPAPYGDDRATVAGQAPTADAPGDERSTVSGSNPNLPAPVPPAQLPDVRPSVIQHVVGVISPDSEPAAFVPVRQLLDVPARPVLPLLATLLSIVGLVVVALLGLSITTDHDGTVSGALTINDTDIVTTDHVTVNFGDDIRVSAAQPPSGATSVALELSARGIPVASSDDADLTRQGGAATAAIKFESARFTLAGPVDGKLVFKNAAGDEVGSQQVRVQRETSGFLSVPGVIVVLLTLFVLGYLESLIRPMRKLGKWRPAAGVGLAFVGLLGGVVLDLLVWVFGRYEPNVVTLAVCGLLGAFAAVLGGYTAAGWGLVTRIKRINKRAPSAPVLR